MQTVPQTAKEQEAPIRDTTNVRVYVETQSAILQEQARRALTGTKPTYADLVEEAWALYTAKHRRK